MTPSRPMADPRLSEASPAELIEMAVAKLGWSMGPWSVEFVMRDGKVERVHAKSTSGRHALLERAAAETVDVPESAA